METTVIAQKGHQVLGDQGVDRICEERRQGRKWEEERREDAQEDLEFPRSTGEEETKW